MTEYGQARTGTPVDDTVMWAKSELENFGDRPGNNPLHFTYEHDIFRIHAEGKTNQGPKKNAHKRNHLCADVESMAGADRLRNDFRETGWRAGQVIEFVEGNGNSGDKIKTIRMEHLVNESCITLRVNKLAHKMRVEQNK